MISKRLRRDFIEVIENAKKGKSCYIENTIDTKIDMQHFSVLLKGPEKTPYFGGLWKLDIKIPSDYPFSAPIVKFKTSIYHPNIKEYIDGDHVKDGSICLDVLSTHWMPSCTIDTVIQTISALLGKPNPDDPLSHDIGIEYKDNYELFIKNATKYTQKYSIMI